MADSHKPLKIALDFNPVLRSRHSGLWTLGAGLLGGLVETQAVESISLLCSREQAQAAADMPAWRHEKCRPVVTNLRLRRWERLWNVLRYPPLQNWCGQFDLFHSMHHLMPPVKGRPRVLTVLDLRRYRLPELYGRSKTDRFQRAAAAADRIVTISQATKDDLVTLLGVAPEKVDAAPLGTPPGLAPADDRQRAATRQWLSRRLGSPLGGYALAIGSQDRRKNLPAAVEGFRRALEGLPGDYGLVILGHLPKDDPHLVRSLEAPELAGRVLLAGPLDDRRHREVLAAADMLLFLSRYEGFGLPLLEAMASGTPVIAAANSSIPEVVGPAGRLLADGDLDGVASAIVALAGDEPARKAMIRAGLERCGQFTWKRTAERVIECYRKALQA